MLDKFLEDYIDKLYQNSNINMELEQQNLYKKSDYYRLLKPVIDLLKNNKDLTLNELRSKLYELSGIEENVKEFIFKKEMAPGLVFTYGTNNYRETVVVGNSQEVGLDNNGNIIPELRSMTSDTIFDLASVTKVYTSLTIFKLVSLGLINLDDEIVKYAPVFKNLKGVTIFDLLTFKTPLQTSAPIAQATSKEEALNILSNIKVGKLQQNQNPYSDMGCMVLKYVIEAVVGNYYEFIENNILKPLHMHDTHVLVPNYKLNRTASTLGGVKYYKDGSFDIDTLSKVGIVHDPKAKILGQPYGDLPGHAGLFSTATDMSKLAGGIIDRVVIDDKYLEEMVKNRRGKPYTEDGKVKYVQYLGSLCYSKNPNKSASELFHAMSGRSFGSGGFTGTQFTVDPINQLYFFLGGNRVHNRLVDLASERKNEVITLENGKKIIKLPNGKVIVDARTYAGDRDTPIVHAALSLLLQYKMLEDFYKLTNEKITYQENTKTIK